MTSSVYLPTALPAALLLFFLALGGCDSGGGSVQEGISVDFHAGQDKTPDADGSVAAQPVGPKSFSTTEGAEVTIYRGYLVLWSATLKNACAQPGFVSVEPSWLDWMVAPAHAHAAADPTRLSVPNVINLRNPDRAEVALGVIGPPPGSYCGVTVELLKADADTRGLPQDIDMIGRTLYLEGAYVAAPGEKPVPFTVDTGRSLLPAHRLLAFPLDLGESNRSARIVIGIRYDRWFDGVDLAQLDDPLQQAQLFSNVVDSIYLR